MNIFNFLWRGFFGRFSIKHDFFGVELMASLAKNEDVTQVLLQDSTTTWSTQGRIAFKICRVPPMGLIVNALSYPSKKIIFPFVMFENQFWIVYNSNVRFFLHKRKPCFEFFFFHCNFSRKYDIGHRSEKMAWGLLLYTES